MCMFVFHITVFHLDHDIISVISWNLVKSFGFSEVLKVHVFFYPLIDEGFINPEVYILKLFNEHCQRPSIIHNLLTIYFKIFYVFQLLTAPSLLKFQYSSIDIKSTVLRQ